MTIIIERLIERREAMGISKLEASKRVGVPQPTYLRYETGEREPSIHVLKDIAKALNTSVDYLTGASNTSTPDSITINKKENPEVFSIIENYENWNDKQIKRLVEYAKKINELKSK